MTQLEYDQAAEIERLKAELELTKKVLEQATRKMTVDDWRDIVAKDSIGGVAVIGSNRLTPELYAHLGGGK